MIYCSWGRGQMKMTEAQQRAVNKYNRNNTFNVSFRLNKNTQADIIEYVKQKTGYGTENPHVKEYILSLIQKDMEDNN